MWHFIMCCLAMQLASGYLYGQQFSEDISFSVASVKRVRWPR